MKKPKYFYLLLPLLFFISSFSKSADSFETAPLLPSPLLVQKESKDKEIASKGYQIKTIVLDAGHGGRDAGCSGNKSKEKYIALNVVLKLGKTIEGQFPHIKVIYTRKTDIFIPLYKRAAIANKNNADLFISIHCNALSHKAHLVHGSETYVMGLHTADHNLDVARRENESILLEDDYQQNYQGFDPNSDEGHIFLTMFQNAFLDKSIQFAEKVEAKIKTSAQRRSRGVKQAGFVVLKETTMPSVLIETGYLSNNYEEAFLATDYGQNKMATAIFEAFVDYKLEVEEEQTFEPAIAIKQAPAPISVIASTNYPTSLNTQKERSKETLISRPKAIPTSLTVSKQSAKENKVAQKLIPPKAVEIPVSKKPAIIFKIQLAASPAEIETSNQKWSKIQFVEVRKEKRLYKYLTGSHTTYELAVINRNDILTKGFNGAFVVAYKDGERIPLQAAKAVALGAQ